MMMSKLGCRFMVVGRSLFPTSIFLYYCTMSIPLLVCSTKALAHCFKNPIHVGSPSMGVVHTSHTLKPIASSSLLVEVIALSYWRPKKWIVEAPIDLCHFFHLEDLQSHGGT